MLDLAISQAGKNSNGNIDETKWLYNLWQQKIIKFFIYFNTFVNSLFLSKKYFVKKSYVILRTVGAKVILKNLEYSFSMWS